MRRLVLSLSILLVLLTLFGPVMINLFVLLPQTAENREIASRVEQYNDVLRQRRRCCRLPSRTRVNARHRSRTRSAGSATAKPHPQPCASLCPTLRAAALLS